MISPFSPSIFTNNIYVCIAGIILLIGIIIFEIVKEEKERNKKG